MTNNLLFILIKNRFLLFLDDFTLTHQDMIRVCLIDANVHSRCHWEAVLLNLSLGEDANACFGPIEIQSVVYLSIICLVIS